LWHALNFLHLASFLIQFNQTSLGDFFLSFLNFFTVNRHTPLKSKLSNGAAKGSPTRGGGQAVWEGGWSQD